MQTEHGLNHIEFFAGIGAVTTGLGDEWKCLWANDYSKMKADVFAANHPDVPICLDDVRNVESGQIPLSTMATCTFPCTNTSAASDRTGLMGIKSGVVYRYIELLREKGGALNFPVTLLENPTGLIARNKGGDLRDLLLNLNELGYICTLVCVDARHFVPQSRPRIFIVGVAKGLGKKMLKPLRSALDIPLDENLYPPPLRKWLGNNLDLHLFVTDLPALPELKRSLVDCLDFDDDFSMSEKESRDLINNMAPKHRSLFDRMCQADTVGLATISRRTRVDEDGRKFNATELNVSGLAPAQRPYTGGSSRTFLVLAGNGKYRFRVVSPRESARLMGFDDDFILPKGIREGYQCTGDAVVPQCVSWVRDHLIEPLLKGRTSPVAVASREQLEFFF
jgi:DNA (cytosine-5)-methyltransferase 1